MFANGKLQGFSYAPIENYVYKPQLNGGLYTGAPFQQGAPWSTVHVVPDTGAMMTETLKTASPPPQAQYHYPGAHYRPGNNTPLLPGIIDCHGFKAINTDAPNVGYKTGECYSYCAGFAKRPQC